MNKKVSISSYVDNYMSGLLKVINIINHKDVKKCIQHLIKLKRNSGRLFLLGIGGSAANCSHAVNDFRKICNIEAYTPTDNVAELTARINDDGWDTVFVNWLKGSRLTKKDTVMVFSVGGGNIKTNVSTNIVKALQYSKKIGTTIIGVVSRNGGYTKKAADILIHIPTISLNTTTPYAESLQVVFLHAIVNYPALASA